MTHIDVVSQEVLDNTLDGIREKIKVINPKKIPMVVRTEEDTVVLSRSFIKEQPIPIFQLSNVTGQSMELFHNFLNLLPSNSDYSKVQDKHTQFFVSDVFIVNNRVILGGVVQMGSLVQKQKLHLGPCKQGKFYCVEITEIQCKRINVRVANCGQLCSVAIKPLSFAKEWLDKNPHEIRRGMVLVEQSLNPQAVHEFLAELWLIGEQEREVVLRPGYKPVLNTFTTRQVCKIVICKEEDKQLKQLQLMRKVSKSTDTRKEYNNYMQKNVKTYVYSKNLLKPTKKQKTQQLFNPSSQNLVQTHTPDLAHNSKQTHSNTYAEKKYQKLSQDITLTYTHQFQRSQPADRPAKDTELADRPAKDSEPQAQEQDS